MVAMFAKLALILFGLFVLALAGLRFMAFLANSWHPWSGNPIESDEDLDREGNG